MSDPGSAPEDPQPNAAGTWETIAAEARTLHGAPRSTIRPHDDSIGTTGRRALRGFEHASPIGLGADGEARFEIGDKLGEGGRGVVHSARQTAMAREVALKAVRPELRGSSRLTLELLQEAWIAGRLEHPNIIPVYDIAAGDDGSPLIVLKRIEGETWASLLAEPERARALLDETDLLEAHLRILIAVCNALHFAHDRRILHLDLKPENVMIGGHGEVYVVDWGVAAALEDDGTEQLPLVARRDGIVGTPSYMSPEMVAGDGAALDERTDVYLLGATLFEVLAGRPPHRGTTIVEVLYNVLHELPALPEDTPAELEAICRRAMAKRPDDRFADALELRRALDDFLRHRGSIRLAEQAAEALDELEATLDDTVADPLEPGGHDEPRRRELFARVRFGFEQALATWPENPAAREGLQRAFARVIEYELAAGDPLVSQALASEVENLPPELRERIEAAVAKRRAGLDELVQHRVDQDLRIGQRTRVFVVGLLGFAWSLTPLGQYIWGGDRTDAQKFTSSMVVPGISVVVLLGLFVWARESLTRTRANRIIVAALAISLVEQVAISGFGFMLGLDPDAVITMMPLTWASNAILIGMFVDKRMVLVAIAFMAGPIVGVLWPAHLWLGLSIGNTLFFIGTLIVWWPERVRGPLTQPDHSV